jgi:cytochrome c-type biogenesis protein CcmF
MKNTHEGFVVALYEVISRAKRRYGGYLVHMGLAAMYLGFTGAAWDKEQEAALHVGQTMTARGFVVRYDGSRMEVDPNKRMIFTDLTVLKDGKRVAGVSPAKFVYTKPQDTTTTEVAIRSTLSEDIYAIMNSVNPQTKVGTFRVLVRPFVAWIWLGGLFMIFGTFVCMSPSVREVLGEVSSRNPAPRASAALATTVVLGLLVAMLVFFGAGGLAHGQADGTSSLHAGSVTMNNPTEKQLFDRLLCMCGDCQRLPLSQCVCSWADDMRSKLRDKLASGQAPETIQAAYRDKYGAKAIAIPADRGLDRALWAVPLTLIGLAAGALIWRGRAWVRRTTTSAAAAAVASGGNVPVSVPAGPQPYDAALDAELHKLDE